MGPKQAREVDACHRRHGASRRAVNVLSTPPPVRPRIRFLVVAFVHPHVVDASWRRGDSAPWLLGGLVLMELLG